MSIWIEILSEYRFKQKISNIAGLYAPKTTRYINMLKDIQPKDIVFHYITASGTEKKEYKSSIIGVSKIQSKMHMDRVKLVVKIQDIYNFPKPINKKEIIEIKNKSYLLKKLININFQRYLSKISTEDFVSLCKIHHENFEFIKNIKPFFDNL